MSIFVPLFLLREQFSSLWHVYNLPSARIISILGPIKPSLMLYFTSVRGETKGRGLSRKRELMLGSHRRDGSEWRQCTKGVRWLSIALSFYSEGEENRLISVVKGERGTAE